MRGDWKFNQKNGSGNMKYENGDIYKGEWKNNDKNGKGIYYYNNGFEYEAIWENGEVIVSQRISNINLIKK